MEHPICFCQTIKIVSITIIGYFVLSCKKEENIRNFDKIQWDNYQKECSYYRLETIQNILDQEDQLLRKNQNEIVKLLGKPSEHELSSRNRKYFYYLLTPQPPCKKISSSQKYLSIRFNALGIADELIIY